MSQTPTPEKVQQMRMLAMQYRQAEKAIEVDTKEFERLRRNIQRNNERRTELQHQITKLLGEMDCVSVGNNGWKERITWMLSELVTQEVQGFPPNKPDEIGGV